MPSLVDDTVGRNALGRPAFLFVFPLSGNWYLEEATGEAAAGEVAPGEAASEGY